MGLLNAAALVECADLGMLYGDSIPTAQNEAALEEAQKKVVNLLRNEASRIQD